MKDHDPTPEDTEGSKWRLYGVRHGGSNWTVALHKDGKITISSPQKKDFRDYAARMTLQERQKMALHFLDAMMEHAEDRDYVHPDDVHLGPEFPRSKSMIEAHRSKTSTPPAHKRRR